MDWPNLVSMLFSQAQTRADQPFFWARRAESWEPVTWDGVARQVSALACAFRDAGLNPGDRVFLLADNSPEWAIADFAVMAAGGVTVPGYTTSAVPDIRHVIDDSGARFAVVGDGVCRERFLEATREESLMERAIVIGDPQAHASFPFPVEYWAHALERGARAGGDAQSWADDISEGDLACLIYTSGTGGMPKGVMLSHRAVLTNCRGALQVLEGVGVGHEIILSFLPLSHAYEHSCGLMFSVAIGAEVYYAESLDTLVRDFAEVKPTILLVVPRLLEVMRQKILTAIDKAGGFKAWLFGKALDTGKRRFEGKRLGIVDGILDAVAELLVRRKVRARFGGHLKAMVSGGAPLAYEVGMFYASLGLRLLQGYGQTEAAPVISCNQVDQIKLATVGPPLVDVEVKIADDGEILVRGPLLMDGYWNLPEVSAETIRDGWLHTGDIGHLDEDGHLEITDRKKNIIVITGGDNIAPQRIEGILTLQPEIEQAMVIGDAHPHLVGLVVPEPTFAQTWARENGMDPYALSENEEFHKVMSAAVARASEAFSQHEKVRRFVLADEPFTVDNAMMTPTMKIRRSQVLERYGERLEALYARSSD